MQIIQAIADPVTHASAEYRKNLTNILNPRNSTDLLPNVAAFTDCRNCFPRFENSELRIRRGELFDAICQAADAQRVSIRLRPKLLISIPHSHLYSGTNLGITCVAKLPDIWDEETTMASITVCSTDLNRTSALNTSETNIQVLMNACAKVLKTKETDGKERPSEISVAASYQLTEDEPNPILMCYQRQGESTPHVGSVLHSKWWYKTLGTALSTSLCATHSISGNSVYELMSDRCIILKELSRNVLRLNMVTFRQTVIFDATGYTSLTLKVLEPFVDNLKLKVLEWPQSSSAAALFLCDFEGFAVNVELILLFRPNRKSGEYRILGGGEPIMGSTIKNKRREIVWHQVAKNTKSAEFHCLLRTKRPENRGQRKLMQLPQPSAYVHISPALSGLITTDDCPNAPTIGSQPAFSDQDLAQGARLDVSCTATVSTKNLPLKLYYLTPTFSIILCTSNGPSSELITDLFPEREVDCFTVTHTDIDCTVRGSSEDVDMAFYPRQCYFRREVVGGSLIRRIQFSVAQLHREDFGAHVFCETVSFTPGDTRIPQLRAWLSSSVNIVRFTMAPQIAKLYFNEDSQTWVCVAMGYPLPKKAGMSLRRSSTVQLGRQLGLYVTDVNSTQPQLLHQKLLPRSTEVNSTYVTQMHFNPPFPLPGGLRNGTAVIRCAIGDAYRDFTTHISVGLQHDEPIVQQPARGAAGSGVFHDCTVVVEAQTYIRQVSLHRVTETEWLRYDIAVAVYQSSTSRTMDALTEQQNPIIVALTNEKLLIQFDFGPKLGFGNLEDSQPSCFLLMAWQLGTERVLRLNDDDDDGVFSTSKISYGSVPLQDGDNGVFTTFSLDSNPPNRPNSLRVSSLRDELIGVGSHKLKRDVFQMDGDRLIPPVAGWRRCKIWLPTDVSGDLVVSLYPDCLNEYLEEFDSDQYYCGAQTVNSTTLRTDPHVQLVLGRAKQVSFGYRQPDVDPIWKHGAKSLAVAKPIHYRCVAWTTDPSDRTVPNFEVLLSPSERADPNLNLTELSNPKGVVLRIIDQHRPVAKAGPLEHFSYRFMNGSVIQNVTISGLKAECAPPVVVWRPRDLRSYPLKSNITCRADKHCSQMKVKWDWIAGPIPPLSLASDSTNAGNISKDGTLFLNRLPRGGDYVFRCTVYCTCENEETSNTAQISIYIESELDMEQEEDRSEETAGFREPEGEISVRESESERELHKISEILSDPAAGLDLLGSKEKQLLKEKLSSLLDRSGGKSPLSPTHEWELRNQLESLIPRLDGQPSDSPGGNRLLGQLLDELAVAEGGILPEAREAIAPTETDSASEAESSILLKAIKKLLDKKKASGELMSDPLAKYGEYREMKEIQGISEPEQIPSFRFYPDEIRRTPTGRLDVAQMEAISGAPHVPGSGAPSISSRIPAGLGELCPGMVDLTDRRDSTIISDMVGAKRFGDRGTDEIQANLRAFGGLIGLDGLSGAGGIPGIATGQPRGPLGAASQDAVMDILSGGRLGIAGVPGGAGGLSRGQLLLYGQGGRQRPIESSWLNPFGLQKQQLTQSTLDAVKGVAVRDQKAKYSEVIIDPGLIRLPGLATFRCPTVQGRTRRGYSPNTVTWFRSSGMNILDSSDTEGILRFSLSVHNVAPISRRFQQSMRAYIYPPHKWMEAHTLDLVRLEPNDAGFYTCVTSMKSVRNRPSEFNITKSSRNPLCLTSPVSQPILTLTPLSSINRTNNSDDSEKGCFLDRDVILATCEGNAYRLFCEQPDLIANGYRLVTTNFSVQLHIRSPKGGYSTFSIPSAMATLTPLTVPIAAGVFTSTQQWTFEMLPEYHEAYVTCTVQPELVQPGVSSPVYWDWLEWEFRKNLKERLVRRSKPVKICSVFGEEVPEIHPNPKGVAPNRLEIVAVRPGEVLTCSVKSGNTPPMLNVSTILPNALYSFEQQPLNKLDVMLDSRRSVSDWVTRTNSRTTQVIIPSSGSLDRIYFCVCGKGNRNITKSFILSIQTQSDASFGGQLTIWSGVVICVVVLLRITLGLAKLVRRIFAYGSVIAVR
ncbi:hypothetical protein CLF_108777 [Clonorchis sinensis]|uniref:Ig-like domain-containing protein n=1 Tax=Clonorchis sinensis TaxID=79923 RepID=G7YII2_CLOSI|nr:hypothetical protein CLF_108777 [Clonorchis sinensis]